MLTHRIQTATQPGFMQVTDTRTGQIQLVFVGDAASRVQQTEIRPMREAPSQKWGAVIAA